MPGLLVRWAVSAAALWLTSLVVRGIEIHGVASLVFAALTIGALIGDSGRVETVHVRRVVCF